MSETLTRNAAQSSATSTGTVPRHAPRPIARVGSSVAAKLLPFVLSMVAGSVDVIGFLGLGLFTAHITGNLVILAAHLVAGAQASPALVISVPLFIAVLAATRILAEVFERTRVSALHGLLWVHAALVCAFLAICIAAGPGTSPSAPSMVLAGMLGVSAMAVQNGLVRIALMGSPSTAVLTTNLTLLVTDLGEILLGRDAQGIARARARAKDTWPVVAGFLLGCALGASCQAIFGLKSLVLPVGFAAAAIALAVIARPRPTTNHRPH